MFNVILIFFKDLHTSFTKNNVYKALIVTGFIMITAATCFYYFEQPGIEGLSYWDSLWWSFVTVTTVGYGDYFPATLIGRIMAGILMIAGIGSFGFVTAAVASAFVELNLKRGMGLMKLNLNNHIIIVGWNKRSINIVEELVREMPDKNIVIIDNIERLETEYKQVFFVHGKGTEDAVLDKACIKTATLAIILANENSNDEETSDAFSVLVCLAINNLNPDIHLVAEAINEDHIPHFKRANVDEVFVSSRIGSKLLIRGALYPEVSKTINELLTNSRGSEFYQMNIPSDYWGISFKELINMFTDEEKGIPIGISDIHDTYVNPSINYIIKEGDVLIYIGKETIV